MRARREDGAWGGQCRCRRRRRARLSALPAIPYDCLLTSGREGRRVTFGGARGPLRVVFA